MIFKKLNNYILYNLFNELIIESKISFKNSFKNVLKSMSSPISKELLNSINREIDIDVNYIDITDREDLVSFYTDTKEIKYKIIDEGEIYPTFWSLFKIASNSNTSFAGSLPNGTVGSVIKIYNPENCSIVSSSIAHFISDDGKNCMIGINGIDEIPIGRVNTIKVGRIIKKILNSLNKTYTDKEIESFINEFKSKISIINNRHLLFEIVNGDEIKFWYCEDNYDNTKVGTLQNSCMKNEHCQNFFDIYTKNKDVCSMLILKSPDNNNLIIGRALVWKLHDGNTFMDRIYYSYDSDIDLFIEYAKKQKWSYKLSQNSNDGPLSNDKRKIKVILKNIDFNHYPYMDTLKYLNDSDNSISNIKEGMCSLLDSTHGGIRRP